MAWGSSDLFLAQDMSVLEEKSTTTDAVARKMWRPMSARQVRVAEYINVSRDEELLRQCALTLQRRFMAPLVSK
jgi:hypothetical protein